MLQTLKTYFGYDSFRPLQEEIIRHILDGNDALVLMPTGGGKSICYQLPALLREGTAVVVSPLISLMKDQVEALCANGISAGALNSSNDETENAALRRACTEGKLKLLYISPEKLLAEANYLLRDMHISLFAIDEAHCISQWGYDFRPAYLKIAEIRELLPDAPVLALTATATPEVVKDIQTRLHFRRENVFRMSFERNNLAYIVRKTENKTAELLHILRSMSGSAIVYVRNRRRTKEITELLNNEDITADFYHAGLDDASKDIRQHRWQSGENRVMVATNAFGMGIDKPDVRIVIHMDLPDSIEAYFQEAGRAGRDGQKAYAVILYAKSDKTTLHKRIPDTFPEKDYIKDVYEHLQYYYQMAMGDGLECVREFNIEDFCRKFKHFPVPVDSALKILTQAGYLEYTGEQDNTSRILFTIRRDELYRLREMGEDMDKLIQAILRSYTGVFTDYTYINEDSLAVRTGLTRRQIYELLVHLAKLHIVNYIPHKKTPYIIYTRERVEAQRIHLSPEIYEERKARYEARINSILDYVTNDTVCRSRMLLDYFGERNEHNCGQCDTCISLRSKSKVSEQPDRETLCAKVCGILSRESLTPAGLLKQLPMDKELLTEILHRLSDEGKIIAVDGILQIRK